MTDEISTSDEERTTENEMVSFEILNSKLRRIKNEQFGGRYMVTYKMKFCVSIRESEYRTRNEYEDKGPVNMLDRAILSDYRLCICGLLSANR